MKRKAMIAWCILVVCVIATVVLRLFADAQEVEYEEVEVIVLSAKTERGYDTQTHSSYEKHEVKVEYQDEIYELKNVYNTYSYREGSKITAYLSNGRLFANVEGVSSSTPLFMTYIAFLVGSFVMFIVALYYLIKAYQERKS